MSIYSNVYYTTYMYMYTLIYRRDYIECVVEQDKQPCLISIETIEYGMIKD